MIPENEFLQKWDEFVSAAAPNKEQHLRNLRSLVCKSLSNFTNTLDLSSLESKIKFSNTMITSFVAIQKSIADIQYSVDETITQSLSETINVVLPTVYSDSTEQDTLCNNIALQITSKLSNKENLVVKDIIYTYTDVGYDMEIILG